MLGRCPVKTRVLVADDHPMAREWLAGVLGAPADLEVGGTAADAATTLCLAAQLHPDVLVLDLRLPDASGVAVAGEVREISPQTAVVVLTGYDDPAYPPALAAP